MMLITQEGELAAMRHVLVGEEYVPRTTPTTILDLGANVGFATLYFHRRFPGSRIVAVEADPSNYEKLKHNVGMLPSVTTVHAAVVGEDGPVAFFPDANGLVSSTRPLAADAPEITVRGITIASLMREHDLDTADLVKLDIEGAELEALRHAPLDRIGEVIAEIHYDRLDANEQDFRSLLADFDACFEPGDQPQHSLLYARK
jgi:FkbM family methyltransferase